MSLMSMIGSWQFWVAVAVVTTLTHLILGYVMPKLSGGGSGA